MAENKTKLAEALDDPLTTNVSNGDPKNKKEWVKFEDDESKVKATHQVLFTRNKVK